MKIVYIAHPISGDVENNLMKIIEIVQMINLNNENVLPFVPYYADCLALDDANPKQRARGIRNGQELLKAGFIDELWLYGHTITEGMRNEIVTAVRHGIVVRPQTVGTQSQYYNPTPTLS